MVSGLMRRDRGDEISAEVSGQLEVIQSNSSRFRAKNEPAGENNLITVRRAYFGGVPASRLSEFKSELRSLLPFQATLSVDFASDGILEILCDGRHVQDLNACMTKLLVLPHFAGISSLISLRKRIQGSSKVRSRKNKRRVDSCGGSATKFIAAE